MENIKDQPDPIPTKGIPIWELVIRDMQERDRTGTIKYGTPLQAYNGRNSLVDAYQEILDLAVYLRQAIEEGLSCWIDCKSALPSEDEEVLICLKSGEVEIAELFRDFTNDYNWSCPDGWYTTHHSGEVTHWMPKPKGPRCPG